ncbi:MAG: hypothetical protein WBD20_14085 [Pirellulaceae bacterium]
MKNPWLQLPTDSPFVLSEDRRVIEQFNLLVADNRQLRIQDHLLPEPYFGNPDASLVVLGLNPGYTPQEDDVWHANVEFVKAIRQSHAHEEQDYPHYYLNPRFKDAPGSRWWRRKCRWLIDDCGIDKVANGMICVELFAYHSTKYKPFPKSLSDSRFVRSANYSAHLVREAISQGKRIVAMRAFKGWCALVPELLGYDHLVRLNSAQNVSMSPKNLPSYDEIATELCRNSP